MVVAYNVHGIDSNNGNTMAGCCSCVTTNAQLNCENIINFNKFKLDFVTRCSHRNMAGIDNVA